MLPPHRLFGQAKVEMPACGAGEEWCVLQRSYWRDDFDIVQREAHGLCERKGTPAGANDGQNWLIGHLSPVSQYSQTMVSDIGSSCTFILTCSMRTLSMVSDSRDLMYQGLAVERQLRLAVCPLCGISSAVHAVFVLTSAHEGQLRGRFPRRTCNPVQRAVQLGGWQLHLNLRTAGCHVVPMIDTNLRQQRLA